MDMDHLIGQRFSLISKSEIRYVGTLHEINAVETTIALEDVYSHGTEGRKVDRFIPASQQKFEYIVFRGSDVKDIKIVEGEGESQPSPPPNIPNDPAILNSSRPGPPQGTPQGPPQNRDESPFPPPTGYPPQHHFQGYYPPPQQGRGFGPPPPGQYGSGPGFQGYPPPPPGYYGPPGQGFPQGANQFQHPPPIGPPGQRGPMNQPPPQGPPQQQHQPPAPTEPQPTSELPVDNKARSKQPSASTTPAPPAVAPVPKPAAPPTGPSATAFPPSGPKSAFPQPQNAFPQPKSNRVTPAVPLTVNQKSFAPPTQSAADAVPSGTSTTKAVPSQAAMDEATLKAKEAVAAALAKLPHSAAQPGPVPTGASIDALAKKVGDMGPISNGAQRGRGGFRGRGPYPRTGSGGHQARKIDIPKSDYDFELANAKFNKEDLIKEAIASGSPVAEAADENANGTHPDTDGLKRKDSMPASTEKAYNKTTSFFDNISSEAKDREDGPDVRNQARQQRGEEMKRNVETFGQANIDGGHRGRGRGRGRAYGGTYRGGFNRGGFGNTGFRGRGRGGQSPAAQPSSAPVAQS